MTEDPFRESMWRLKMRLADATGDTDRIITAYRACERALAQLGTRPAVSTRRLLDDLRR
ncbi:BTAD domain-containing putative transcriptional regulator [Rhodococcus aetherivorans]|uniref:BTAD domain-containing putative transcriptional regulator n=1 Tax=Rhodococcus aetherivorans TaxID=191292 RepID=UPI0021AE07F0|nr:BTAD domain-containing putative transcriptional regulator [Rhodococcus aetherivorans]